MPSNYLILCRPLLLLPSVFPSIRVFSNELALHIRWPKYWSFSFSISPSNKYSGLISFRIDCLDLLAAQETFKNLLQQHSSKASILWCSAFNMVQLQCRSLYLKLLEKQTIFLSIDFLNDQINPNTYLSLVTKMSEKPSRYYRQGCYLCPSLKFFKDFLGVFLEEWQHILWVPSGLVFGSQLLSFFRDILLLLYFLICIKHRPSDILF